MSFFQKVHFDFLEMWRHISFQDKPKKIDSQWGWKITTYRSKFATPFLWVVFTGKKWSKLFLCVLLKKFLTVNHLGLILYFIKVWSYRGEKIPPCVRSPLLLSLVFSCFDFDLGEFMMKSYFLCDFFFPHNFFMPHEFWLLLNVILLCVRYIWILFKQLK